MKNLEEIVTMYTAAVKHCLDALDPGAMKKTVNALWQAYQRDKQIFLCGNGGSAATASHLACDLGKGVTTKGKKRPKIISLTDNVPLITAWSNDTSYENCFAEQLAPLLNEKDVLIGISASGNSKNVIKAAQYAKSKGALTIGFVGFGGGVLRTLVDIAVLVDSSEYEVTEDVHLCIGHIVKKALLALME